ncbi:MAG: glycosyltransferase family 39 protein [Candidatus Omnitrophica bacterium]|nr:glycosyltransferase family 39 protein [Candidatus Omnitrophota bacterium]
MYQKNASNFCPKGRHRRVKPRFCNNILRIIGFLKKPITKSRFNNLLTSIPYELWLIIVVAFSLRVYHLGYHDLWYDEVITLIKISKPDILQLWNPPLYYIILAGWVKIFGFSEVSLRFPSLLFSLACVPAIYLLGKELFNKSAGIFASLITALSPFQLWYAQEARSYSLLAFLGLLSSYSQFLFINRKQNKFLYWCIAFAILGVYTHPYYIFFAISQLICCVICMRKRWSVKMLIASLLVSLSFIPIMRKSWIRLSAVMENYWISTPSWKSLLISIENFNLGYNSHLLTYFIFDILSLILVIAVVWSVKKKAVSRKGIIFCFSLFILPLIFTFTFSRLIVPIYFDRGLIISTPFYYLILGLGISAFRKKILRFSVIILILTFLTVGIYGFLKGWMPTKQIHHVGVHPKKPIEPVVEFIKKNSAPEDIIAFTNDSVKLPFIWYSEGRNYVFFSGHKKGVKPSFGKFRFIFGPKSVTPSYRQPRKEDEFNIPLGKVNELEFKKLFVLACDWPRSGNLDKNSSTVKEKLDEIFNLEMKREFDGLWVYKYGK